MNVNRRKDRNGGTNFSSTWSMQVSHHPPIFAFHTESNCRSYQCYGEIEIKNKFWGRSIEVTLSSKISENSVRVRSKDFFYGQQK